MLVVCDGLAAQTSTQMRKAVHESSWWDARLNLFFWDAAAPAWSGADAEASDEMPFGSLRRIRCVGMPESPRLRLRQFCSVRLPAFAAVKGTDGGLVGTTGGLLTADTRSTATERRLRQGKAEAPVTCLWKH